MEKKLNYKILLIHSFYWLFEVVEIYFDNSFFNFWIYYPVFIGTFYLHYFVLIPLILKRPTIASLLKWFAVFFVIFALRRYVCYLFEFEFFPSIGWGDFKGDPPPFSDRWQWIILGFITNSSGILAVSLGSRFVKNKTKLAELERQKVKNELSALKNQIDIPETINILSKLERRAKSKPDSIQEEIIRLSSVLRYHLYSKEGEVILSKELDVVQNQLDLYNELNQSDLVLDNEIGDRIVKTGILSKAIGEVLKDTHKVESKLELSGIQENTYLKISDKSLGFLDDLRQRFENKFGKQLNIQTSKQAIIIQLN